ncbi:MAG: hypothetical protein JW795_17080 [Chitinivibrionales bacterium]|nr:hypothetical protein [Chitinivibrionales bacterium]
MPAGRPTDYRSEYCTQATKLCMLGAIDKEIASFFNVCEDTINNWKIDHPEFFEAIKEGREIADATVAEKLFHRATGYEHPEDDIKQYNGDIIITPTIKHYPPDTAAAIFWLKNRRRKDWREKHEVELSAIEPVIIKDQDGSKIMELSSRQRPEEKSTQ